MFYFFFAFFIARAGLLQRARGPVARSEKTAHPHAARRAPVAHGHIHQKTSVQEYFPELVIPTTNQAVIYRICLRGL